MLVDKCFDDEFERIIFASVDTPGTTLVLASHVELVGVSFHNIGGKVIFDSISCTGMFQRVNGLPFGAEFKGVHSRCCLQCSGVVFKHGWCIVGAPGTPGVVGQVIFANWEKLKP